MTVENGFLTHLTIHIPSINKGLAIYKVYYLYCSLKLQHAKDIYFGGFTALFQLCFEVMARMLAFLGQSKKGQKGQNADDESDPSHQV